MFWGYEISRTYDIGDNFIMATNIGDRVDSDGDGKDDATVMGYNYEEDKEILSHDGESGTRA